ncbi:MAG: hypothetical protein EBY80_11330 [Actinobacteria bacterium]|jgi:hypothetical protein|nr:hypothetical protein [Actinomycetota bacterium]
MIDRLKTLLSQMETGKRITSVEEFEKIVKSFQMTCSWSATTVDGKNLIQENWISKVFPIFALSRIFDIDSPLVEKMPQGEKIKIFNLILEKEVDVENYEKAAVLRDLINSF